MFVYATGMCDGDGDVESLARLIGSIEIFVAGHAGELTPFELGERLIRLRHGIDLLELRFAREAAGFASTEEAIAQGSTSPIDWIRHQCHMSAQAAGRSVATGEEVDRLPASVTAMEADGSASPTSRFWPGPSGRSRGLSERSTRVRFSNGPSSTQ